MVWKKYHLSAFMVVLFLLLVFPLVLSGLTIQANGISVNRQQTADNFALSSKIKIATLAEHLTSLQSKLDDYSTECLSAMRVLTGDQLLHPEEYYISAFKLHRSFQKLEGADKYISDVMLLYPSCNFLMTTGLGITSYDDSLYNELKRSAVNNASLVLVANDRLFISKFSPISSRKNEQIKPDFILSVEIDKKELENVLLLDNIDGEMVYLIADSQIIYRNAPTRYLDSAVGDDQSVTLDGSQYIRIAVDNKEMNCSLIRYIPISSTYGDNSRLMIDMYLYSLLCAIIFVVYMLLIRRAIINPVTTLQEAFHDLSDNNLEVRIIQQSDVDDFQKLYDGFNSMAASLQQTFQQVITQKIIATEMELKQLQAQIDPHFLYNTFFVLRHRIQEEDYQTAGSMANYLGQYFRYITRNARNEVTFKEEYEHAVSYLEIQKIRFDIMLDVQIDPLPPESAELIVPRLILQPLVENVFSHGRRTDTKKTVISLRIISKITHILVAVEDNGNTLTDEMLALIRQKLRGDDHNQESTAMVNINRRLMIYYHGRGFLDVFKNEAGGLTVQMTIPLNNVEKEKK